MPAIAECGVAGYDVAGWFGALVPAGTPAPIVARLQTELARIMATPQAKDLAAHWPPSRGMRDGSVNGAGPYNPILSAEHQCTLT